MAASHQLKKVSWWHEAIVDWELENPEKSMNECAQEFGVGASYLSIIRNSDCYKEYFALRRQTHNETVSKSIVERTEELAGTTLDVLQDRIDKERDDISLKQVNETCDMALKALGFGGGRGGNSKGDGRGDGNVTVVVGIANPEILANARATMRVVNERGKADAEAAADSVIDVDVETPALPAPA